MQWYDITSRNSQFLWNEDKACLIFSSSLLSGWCVSEPGYPGCSNFGGQMLVIGVSFSLTLLCLSTPHAKCLHKDLDLMDMKIAQSSQILYASHRHLLSRISWMIQLTLACVFYFDEREYAKRCSHTSVFFLFPDASTAAPPPNDSIFMGMNIWSGAHTYIHSLMLLTPWLNYSLSSRFPHIAFWSRHWYVQRWMYFNGPHVLLVHSANLSCRFEVM